MAGETLPDDIYLDSSLVAAAIVPGIAHSQAAAQFCERLAQQGGRVYFSLILRLELAQVFRNLATRGDGLPLGMRQQYRLDRWGADPRVRAQWLAFGLRQFDAFLQQFDEVYELPFTLDIWLDSVRAMGAHGLGSQDAVHLATARVHGLHEFATIDGDFTSISDPHIWLVRDVP